MRDDLAAANSTAIKLNYRTFFVSNLYNLLEYHGGSTYGCH